MPSHTSSAGNNWRSRKLWFSAGAIASLLVGLKFATQDPAFPALYSTYVGGVVGITALLLAGNVATKWTPGAKETAKARDEESAG